MSVPIPMQDGIRGEAKGGERESKSEGARGEEAVGGGGG